MPLRRIAAVALLFLGLATTAVAAEGRAIPVPRATIYPGETISADLVGERIFPVAFLRNRAAVQSPDELVGKVAKRTLLPGYPIDVNSITAPDIVSKNVPVQVIFQDGGLIITSFAAPLQAGKAGDVVTARNVESGITIRGIVQADGTIRVGRM